MSKKVLPSAADAEAGNVSDPRPRCPKCEAIELRRNARSGFWQKSLASRLGYFPWECGQCRQIYMVKQRSIGYRQAVLQGERARLLDQLLLKDRS